MLSVASFEVQASADPSIAVQDIIWKTAIHTVVLVAIFDLGLGRRLELHPDTGELIGVKSLYLVAAEYLPKHIFSVRTVNVATSGTDEFD